MTQEDTFYAFCWKIAAIVICVLTVSVSSCTMFESYLVSSSNDPMRTRCGLGTSNFGNGLCAILADKNRGN